VKRHHLHQLLRQRVPAPWVVALDQRHPSRIVVRDPTDLSDGRHGRWLVQVFQAAPVANATVWHNPPQVLDYLGGESWIVAFDEEPERTGFKDSFDLADFVVTRLQHQSSS
jgi:hypothetical protein